MAPLRREGTAHRQNLYTQTPDSPHSCGRLVCIVRVAPWVHRGPTVDDIFGSWEDWGNTFDLRDSQQCWDADGVQDLYSLVKQSQKETSAPPAITGSTVTMTEVVNLNDLKAYAAKKTDRRQELLEKYIVRVMMEGEDLGDGYFALQVRRH